MASLTGASGVMAGLLWWVLTPLMATVGFCQGSCEIWAGKPWIIRTLGQWLAEYGVFDAGDVLYFRFGRLFVLDYLFMIVALVGFHLLLAARVAVPRGMRLGYRFLLASLSVAAAGDFLSYGVGVFSGFAWRYGFALEMLALLLVAAASIWYGRAVLTLPAGGSWRGAVLVAAGVSLPLMLFDRGFVMYLPNAPVFPLSVAWLALGAHLLLASRRAPSALTRDAFPPRH